ncbi:MAG TPA: Hsp20/alpha crystallin family protein [Acidobacteriota bacterium]
MNLVKWEPFKEFERFFDNDLLPFFPQTKIGWDLAVDVYEEKENVIFEMNLAGIDPKLIEVSFQNGYLKIIGKREEEKETKEKNYFFKEIKRGTFERKVELPTRVKTDKAEATFKNGMLKIVVPKLVEELPGKVNIKVQ